MLPKSHRLHASEIRSVLRSKNRVSGNEFQIIFAKNNLGVSRFAIIVSTKIDKRATARNRIKRLIRESVRHLLPQVQPGWDCVLMARENFADQKQSEAERNIRNILYQAGLVIS